LRADNLLEVRRVTVLDFDISMTNRWLESSTETFNANLLFLYDTEHAWRYEFLSPRSKDVVIIKPLGNLDVRPACGSELSDSIK
jgi:hypothetical protein